MKTKLLYFITAIILFSACGKENGNRHTEHRNNDTPVKERERILHLTAEQIRVNGMKFGTLDTVDFYEYVSANGMIDVPPKYKAAVSPVYGGYIEKFDLLEGDYVRKGQLLFTLQNPEFIDLQREYLRLKEQLQYLKADYERQKQLLDEQIASKKNFLKAQSDYKTAEAAYFALEKKLKMIGIRPGQLQPGSITGRIGIHSPIGGYITEVHIAKGEFLSPENTALRIIDPHHKHAELKVFEKDIPRVHKGQRVLFKVPGNSRTYRGKVFLTGKSIDAEKRFVNVHVHLEEGQNEDLLIPEMFVEARIMTGSERLPALPVTAVMEDEGKSVVAVVKSRNGEGVELELRPVVTGKKNDAFVEIVNSGDFKPGEEVLIDGGYFLLGGEEGGHAH
jgi:cobalt-zinc-cadmium efflux system membrane fusion protein